jgi:hypothetical protein
MPALIADNSIMESMKFEAFIMHPVTKKYGVVVLSSDSQFGKIVKMYSAVESDEDDTYTLSFELYEAVFEDLTYAEEFIEYLPNMSAIELLYVIKDVGNGLVEH